MLTVIALVTNQRTAAAQPNQHAGSFVFKHHSIDTALPVYAAPNGWPIGDYGGAGLADFDNDGDPDVFTCDQEQGSGKYQWLLLENSDGRAAQFQMHGVLDQGLGGHEVQAGDVDGDGDLDLVSKVWGPARDNALAGKMHVDYLENLAIQKH